jgi:hypothetical protein
MTLWKQGASAVPVFLPGFAFLESAGIGIGGVLPIGTSLVTEFAPRRIRAPRCRAIHVDLWLARARPTRPRRRCPERTEPLAPRHVRPTANRPYLRHRNPQSQKPVQRTPPVSKESSPCFLPVILLLEKLSKCLIPLGDCPFVLNRLPVFLRGFNFPAHRNLRVSEGVENLLG